MKKIITFINIGLIILLSFFLLTIPVLAQNSIKKIKIGKVERSYLLHVPSSYNKKNSVPLVIVLHGAGSNAIGAERATGMSTKANQEGFIVAYPNGTGFPIKRLERRNILLTWNVGNCCGPAMDLRSDDVSFIRDLINKTERDYNINPSKIYVLGISNGGMLAYLLACQFSDKIAAIADISGAMNVSDCSPTSPVSILVIHGTADETISYNGGIPRINQDWHKRTDNPVSYAVSFWVSKNGCATQANRTQYGDIIKDSYTSCINGTSVVLYTIINGTHSIPSSVESGKSTTDTIWDFFNSHPKPQKKFESYSNFSFLQTNYMQSKRKCIYTSFYMNILW